MKVKVELQYLPCLAYFACILSSDRIYIDVDERYVKQTNRNRCSVLTANKIDVLTVPVRRYEATSSTKDIQIDHSQEWIRRHLGCLRSAYGKSPYFEYYAPELFSVFDKKLNFLIDFNYELLTICLRLVGIKKDIQYNLSGSLNEEKDVFNAISLINNPKAPDAPDFYQPVPYYQTFGNDFVDNLSIVDLLFNMGPESRLILAQSCKTL